MPIKHSRVTRRLGLKTAIAAAVALPLTSTAPLTATAAAPDRSSRRLEVMSFNLRYASTAEPNSWAARRPVTRELLRRESLHVIGTQEGLYQQVRDIEADLGDRIDWVLTTPGVTAHRASINTFSVNGQFPSDHLPVQASPTPG